MTVDTAGRSGGALPSIAAIVAAFDIPGSPRRLTPVIGAWSHRVFRLDTSQGAHAVKQLLDPWSDANWRPWLSEAWRFELRAFEAGVAMPRPVPASTGDVVADVEARDGQTLVPVRVHEWVDGSPCPVGPVPPPVAAALGRDLAVLHGLGHRPGRSDVFPRASRDSVDRWPELVETVRARDRRLGDSARALSASVARIGELFDAADTDVHDQPMSHGDVDQKNVLLVDAGPVLCDWDVAAPWAPRAELARTAMSLAAWERPEVARQVLAAYRAAGGDDGPVRPEHLTADLVIGLDWLCFCLERAIGLREADHDRRAESRRLVTELLDRLPRKVATALGVGAWLRGP